MGEVPVEFAGAAVDRAGLQFPVFKACDRLHLAVVPGIENLVGRLEFGHLHGALLNLDAVCAHEADQALARYAVEERVIGHRGDGHAVLHNLDIGRGKFCDVTHGIAHHRVLKAAIACVDDGA